MSENDLQKMPELENVPNQKEIDEIMAKYDKSAAYRDLKGVSRYIVGAIAVIFSLFQLYTALFGTFPAQLQRAIHFGFVMLLAFLLYPATSKSSRDKLPVIDIIFGIAGACVAGYLVINYRALIERSGAFTTVDIIVGVVGILLLAEICRRTVGLPILIIAGIFIAYAYLGPYMPGFLNHRGYSFKRIVSHLMFTTEGILGIPMGVCSTFIFLFILFGAFLEKTGIGKFFIDISNAIAGFAAGGPAKVAVLTSALEGTVSGSSVSNTVGSGSFTIPMMKSLGYKPEFAAAVEAAASTGGQIMPPIMGAAAFLMADTLGIPYSQIAVAAIIPALLYFAGIWIMVHFEAKKTGMRGLSKEELPRLWDVLKERGHLVLPLVAIIYFLSQGSTPIKAAMYGIIFAIVASFLKKSTRMKFTDFLDALETGARNILSVAIACGMAGIIIGVVTLTGLGLKMASGLLEISGGSMILTLFFTMLSSLILGMGVPTTANYLITSTITAPAVVQLGVPVLAAHMFTFYFGIVADITPPVALAAYAGSAIAKSNPFKTGVTATKLAIAAFIIPYIFVLNPDLLLINTEPLHIVQIVITSLIGMLGVGAAMEGYFLTHAGWVERLMFLAGGLLLIDPKLVTDLVGLGLIALALVWQIRKKKSSSTVNSVNA